MDPRRIRTHAYERPTQTERERPEWWRAFLRGWAVLLGVALLGMGLLWIGFDREKRGLHDWLAGTYVIRSPGRSS